jgi:hypothetical protein
MTDGFTFFPGWSCTGEDGEPDIFNEKKENMSDKG